ncbi:MAG: bifunctional acetate--CoA ligase family protein/GNAT family N-acetyltransferase [Nocardioides sp.]
MTSPQTTSTSSGAVPPPGGVDVLLADGSVGVVRPVCPQDRAALDALHDGVSADDLRLRFFSASRTAGHEYVEHVLAEAAGSPVGLVLLRAGRVVGLATAERLAPDTAEVAFLVADGQHGLGIGSLLLEHLAAAGRDDGVRRFTAEVLTENHGMLEVFRDAGFALVRRPDAGVVHVELDTDLSDRAVAAADAREAQAEARSLAPLLRPRRVVVAGARRDGTGVGATVLASVVRGGFTGTVSAVHPAATAGSEIAGVPAYASVGEVPGGVDLLVVAVPPAAVADCLRDGAVAGARAAVVVTSGFKELGADGARLEHELLEVARAHSIRLVGPNCLGLLDNQPDVRLDATFAGAVPPAGGLALASQSGGVGIVLMDVARSLGLGVSFFVSLGNKADVSSNDLLAAWQDDPAVSGAALYLESFGNATKFARVARRFAERKPLLAVVGGRSSGGQRAGASHTAAAASPSVGVDALFAQAGVVGCRDAEEMAETALLLTGQPLPAGPRLAVLSNAGGLGVLAADAADRHGLTLPLLSDDLRARVAAYVSGTTGTSNPVDAGAGGTAAGLGALTAELLGADELDAVLLVLVRTGTADPQDALDAVGAARAAHPGKPLLVVAMGGIEHAAVPGATVFGSVEGALRSLAHAVRYAAWRRTPPAPRPLTDRARATAAELVARSYVESVEATADGGWLAPDRARALLAPYGLAPVGELVRGADQAVLAAARLGFPVAAKVADPRVVHKTERGLVRVGLVDAAAVRSAVAAFAAELHRDDVPVLVQPMSTGVEVALGIVRDPGFGPLVMLAAGGVATDVWDDRAFLLTPVTAQDAARALRSLRIHPLLDGYRGAPPVDADALAGLVVALGQLATDVPQVAEVDLNPVLAGPDGTVLVDVKVRLAPGRRVDAGIPRRLRSPG